jgi:conjugative transfer region protein (TIGR03748 family)
LNKLEDGFEMQKKYIKRLRIVYFLLFWLCCSHAYAADDTTIGRYLTVEDKPSPSQVDLLEQTIQVRFPQNIQTVGDALSYLLRLSGYGLVPEAQQSGALKITLTKPLPFIDRDFGPMALKDALTTLVGPAFNLVHNPINRTVNFNLKPAFDQFYTAQTSKS